VTENSPVRLVLRDRTAWLSLLWILVASLLAFRGASISTGSFAAGTWVAPGFLVLAAFICLRTTVFECDKTSRLATLERLKVFKRSTLVIPFSEISDVVVEAEPMPDTGSTPSCRLILVSDSRRIPLTESYEPDSARFHAMRESILGALARP
jgi:hypothetical protein